MSNQIASSEEELRKQVHMKMLVKSENAKDVGDYTVVKLGFAVSIAMQLIATHTAQAVQEARIDELNHIDNKASVYRYLGHPMTVEDRIAQLTQQEKDHE